MTNLGFTHVKDVSPNLEEVELRGWVYRIRKMKGKIFVVLRDSTGIMQCVGSVDKLTEEAWLDLNNSAIENTISVKGVPKEDNRAVNNIELHLDDYNLMHRGEMFPTAKDQSKEFWLDYRHLWLRTTKATHIMKVKASVLRASREWFFENDFHETTPPIISTGAVEGGSTLFNFKYFEHDACLSQSAQLYLEALIFGLEKVYAITPSFRAEKMRTRRHINEFWHIEGEEAFVDFYENMKIQEELVSYIVHYVLDHNKYELKELKRDTSILEEIKTPFKKITYEEAVNLLNEDGFTLTIKDDIKTEEERHLSNKFGELFFVTLSPSHHKPFYTKEYEKDPKWVYSADLVAPEGYGEMITGGQREDNLDVLVKRIKAEGFNPENYGWYLDLRRYGSAPHSGFGLGAERLTWWICGLEDIQDTCAVPRTRNRVYP